MMLEITIGATNPIEVEFLDSTGKAETFPPIDSAILTIKTDNTDTGTEILQLSLIDAEIAFAGNVAICTMSQTTSDALISGTFVGQMAIHFTGQQWAYSNPFYVQISKAYANQVQP